MKPKGSVSLVKSLRPRGLRLRQKKEHDQIIPFFIHSWTFYFFVIFKSDSCLTQSLFLKDFRLIFVSAMTSKERLPLLFQSNPGKEKRIAWKNLSISNLLIFMFTIADSMHNLCVQQYVYTRITTDLVGENETRRHE